MLSRRTTARLLLGATLATILILTLTPGGPGARGSCSSWALTCDEGWGADFVLNVCLFVPFGFAIGLGAERGWWRYLIPALVSAAIELSQGLPAIDRDPSIRDVIANGLGGAIGLAIGAHWTGLARPSAGAARCLALATAAALTLGYGVAGLLLRPSVPAPTWYGQWSPDLGQFDRFRGTLAEATLGDRRMPSGPIADSDRFQQDARDHGYRLRVRATLGSAPTRVAPIASVFDHRQRQIVVLGQRRDQLAFAGRVVGEDFGLHPIWFLAPAGLGDSGSVELDGQLANGRFTGHWRTATATDSVSVTLGAADGWQLLITDRLTIDWRRAVGVVGLALAFLPLGFFAGRAGGPAWIALAVIPAAISLGGVGLGFPPAPWPAWLGALSGLGLGWVVAKVGLRSDSPRASARST